NFSIAITALATATKIIPKSISHNVESLYQDKVAVLGYGFGGNAILLWCRIVPLASLIVTQSDGFAVISRLFFKVRLPRYTRSFNKILGKKADATIPWLSRMVASKEPLVTV